VSLLMDALKKAELAKRQPANDVSEPAAAPESSLELTPLTRADSADPFAGEQSIPPSSVEPAKGGTLPELPATLELLDQEFMDQALVSAQRKVEKPNEPLVPRSTPAAAPAAAQRAAAETQRDRESVQNLFESKQAPATSRTAIIVIAALGLVAVAAIGVYFWLQLQPKSALAPPLGTSLPIKPPPAPVAVAPPAAPVVEPLATKPAAPPPDEPIISEQRPAAPAQAAAPQIPIRVTTSKLRVDPAVDVAFNALQNGDLAAAQAAYEKSLRNDPKNADTLHGLAAVQLRLGKPEAAQDYYLRALEADPKDALAQASLISMSSQIDPGQAESRLKLLLATQGDSPFLHFYLGNLYARQNRWAEAQQDYFKAMSGEPDNPDYLFNLAVSLDQLHQPKLAVQYYTQALAAADKRSAGFDKQQVSDRLKKLQP
jgi:tetratricopeptide (TPR) repeat protein